MDCPHVALDPEIDGIATYVMGVAGSAHRWRCAVRSDKLS